MFQIVGAFAEFERSMIRQRVHAGLKRALANGKTLGRPLNDPAAIERARAELQRGIGIVRASGKIPADVPAYCAEWKRRGRVLGPRPRSRLTDHQRISDDEEAVLSKAICDDLESSGFSLSSSASDDVRGQQFNEMTDRELLGAILKSPIDMLVSGSAIHKRPAPPTNVRIRG
jgi:hypothetical protein